MKKTISAFLALLLILASMVAFATNVDYSTLPVEELVKIRDIINEEIASREALNNLITTTNQSETPADIRQLESGDEVSIIGQVAGGTLINGNTLWVQVLQPDRTFVYHCQLKDEFLDEAEKLKPLNVVKIHRFFLNLMDLEKENTAIIITLYDCEIV